MMITEMLQAVGNATQVVTVSDATEVVPYLTSAVTIVAIQKWLKQRAAYAKFVATFPGADKWAHWFVAGVGSVMAATGIHMTWNWNIVEGGELHAQIPALMTMVHGLSDFYKVYILQHFGYETTHRAPYVPDVDVPKGKK